MSSLNLATTDPHSPPREIQVYNIGERTAHVSWIPPLVQDHNGPLTHYEIHFTPSQFLVIPTVVIQTSNLSISYSDLEEYITYGVVIAAATSTGLGPFSSPVTFATQEAGILLYTVDEFV